MVRRPSEYKLEEGTPRIVKAKNVVSETVEATKEVIGKISWN